MNAKVDRILEELYLIDPSLREAAAGGGEATLRKIIDDLIQSKPEAKLDEAFAAELKEKLLAAYPKVIPPKRRKILAFLARPAFRVAFGTAAAASVLLAVYVGLGPRGGSQVAVSDSGTYMSAPASKPNAIASTAAPKTAITRQNGAAAPAAAPSPAAGAAAGDKDDQDRFAMSAKGFNPQGPASAAPIAPAYSALAKKEKTVGGSIAGEGIAAEVLADRFKQDFNREGYDRLAETSFAKVLEEPLSTFSIDVDTASYANVRRFLRSGQLPPPDAVRIEELVNYFPYDYAGPTGDEPFAFDAELSPCPWNSEHSLLRVALQAKRIADRDIPPSNLVFLIDVSGSMEDENKLPLVKESLKLLARRMRQQDKIAIVVYAGSAGIVLEPTMGSKTDTILKAIDDLESGGSTAGGEGILLAYETAKKAFIPKGLNRVILATDGDFNVGASSDGELVRIIEEQRKAGVFLTVLGFGMGNYQDSKMQKLADSGNGNYAYVDSLAEADKVLAKQMAGTLFTVAKDVKVQIEFNPARVGEYRLIGYEKRALAARDFADDAKDAGELGAGSSVTALYELTAPSGATSRTDLKYQSAKATSEGAAAKELMTLKFRYTRVAEGDDVQPNSSQSTPAGRYKRPDGSASSLIEKPVTIEPKPIAQTSADYRFAAAVAEWGLVLRGSAYKGSGTLEQAASLARGARGRDLGGYRAEFLELVALSEKLSR